MSKEKNINNLEDEIITCCDCGEFFLWTVGEQRYYKSKKLSPPRRCKHCRDERRRSIVPDEGGE